MIRKSIQMLSILVIAQACGLSQVLAAEPIGVDAKANLETRLAKNLRPILKSNLGARNITKNSSGLSNRLSRRKKGQHRSDKAANITDARRIQKRQKSDRSNSPFDNLSVNTYGERLYETITKDHPVQ